MARRYHRTRAQYLQEMRERNALARAQHADLMERYDDMSDDDKDFLRGMHTRFLGILYPSPKQAFRLAKMWEGHFQ
jgi:hypothetical protein